VAAYEMEAFVGGLAVYPEGVLWPCFHSPLHFYCPDGICPVTVCRREESTRVVQEWEVGSSRILAEAGNLLTTGAEAPWLPEG
jgi:hypothetical protein